MDQFEAYASLYPYLPYEIVSFFRLKTSGGVISNRKLFEFCDYYHKKYDTQGIPQPGTVSLICEILMQHNRLSLVEKAGFDNTMNRYVSVIHNEDIFDDPQNIPHFNQTLSYLVYGFKYIYKSYSKYVLPVEHTNIEGDKSLGTCFLYQGGIVTAKHCIEGAKAIAIQGIDPDRLKTAKYHLHSNPYMDLIYIKFKEPIADTLYLHQAAEVLDEVMTMGYPRIPGYHNFLTAENARVSSRFTASVGHVASNAEDIFMRENLFLITAKIRGGNSGGPIIARNGSIVGIAANLAHGEGNYDDLGYGTVIPIRFVDEILSDLDGQLDISEILFKAFEEN